MYSQTEDIVLHSQRAFDLCREQVYDYEDCRQLNYQGQPNPADCASESLKLVQCYEKVEEVEPICMDALNNFRECNFKYHGNLVTCEKEIHEFNRCQENPKWYAEHVYPKVGRVRPIYDPIRNRPKY